ncbi:DUF6585 family protein [Streptomyces sp. NPDC002446]
MTRPTPRTRGEELLLARISAAAGRACLGRRRATYAGAAHPTRTQTGPARMLRGLLAFARYGRSAATRRTDARLDMYEHGMTIAVKGRIHVVRYDTTSVFEKSTRHPHGPTRSGSGSGSTTRTYTLTDVDGKRVVLQCGPESGDAEAWTLEVRRAVIRAQLPRALAALHNGERLAFGGIWLTGEEVGAGEVSARWSQVRGFAIEEAALRLDIDGSWHRWGPAVSKIPNLFVLCALFERLRAADAGSGG